MEPLGAFGSGRPSVQQAEARHHGHDQVVGVRTAVRFALRLAGAAAPRSTTPLQKRDKVLMNDFLDHAVIPIECINQTVCQV